jgi:hypothetical protein
MIRIDWREARVGGKLATDEKGVTLHIAYLKEAGVVQAPNARIALLKAKDAIGPLAIVQERDAFLASLENAKRLSEERRYGNKQVF